MYIKKIEIFFCCLIEYSNVKNYFIISDEFRRRTTRHGQGPTSKKNLATKATSVATHLRKRMRQSRRRTSRRRDVHKEAVYEEDVQVEDFRLGTVLTKLIAGESLSEIQSRSCDLNSLLMSTRYGQDLDMSINPDTQIQSIKLLELVSTITATKSELRLIKQTQPKSQTRVEKVKKLLEELAELNRLKECLLAETKYLLSDGTEVRRTMRVSSDGQTVHMNYKVPAPPGILADNCVVSASQSIVVTFPRSE